MRKVGSAPNLIHYSQSQQERHEPNHFQQRMPKSGSASALSKMANASNVQKEGVRRHGSLPERAREVRSRAFPIAALDTSLPTPPDPAMTEEFAESARGLAGLECFELYGPQAEAPALQSQAQASASERQGDTSQQFDSKAAFASCLATPLTGQDKNLGELVDAEARAMMQVAQEEIAARYEQEVSSQASALTEVAAPERNTSARSRKRRLAEKFGFGGGREKRTSTELFENCPEAQQMLSNMASLDDASNTANWPESSEGSRETNFPCEIADKDIFEWLHPSQRPPPEAYLPTSRTI